MENRKWIYPEIFNEKTYLYKRRKISAQYHLLLARRLSGLLCSIQSPNIYIKIIMEKLKTINITIWELMS